MRSDSDSDSQEEDEKLKQLKEEIRQIEERKIRRKLLKKQSLATSNTPSPEIGCSSSKKLNIDVDKDRNKGNPGSSVQVTSNNNLCLEDKGQQDRFRTYKKLPGAVDHGKEYEQIMCAFYALTLITRDDVEDFEMTTNNKEYGVFDDIGLTVTFKNTKRRIYLIQVKHKEGGKFITTNNLLNQKNDFGVQKYFNSISSLNITEDVVYIVFTNSSTYIKQNTQISPDIVLEVRDCIEYEDLLLNVQERKSSTIFQIVQKLEDKNQMFYFFTEQNNIHNTKVSVQKMLYELMQCNIYDSFMHFMSEWWSKSFVLAKDDVIAKLSELVVSPYLKTLTGDKKNAKTENLRKAITNFSLTIVKKTDENIIENIWSTESVTDDEFKKTKEKFGLKITEQMKILWFLNKVPLVIKVDDLNKAAIKCAVKLIDKSADKKKIILEGNVTKCEFDGMQVFQDLSDLIQKCESEECCRSVLESFEVSLQGREPICLGEFINIDSEISQYIGLGELLKMSQTNFIIGNEREDLPELHIPRNVSTIFVNTNNILSFCESQRFQTVVIMNCDPAFKHKFQKLKNFSCVEISDYFYQQQGENENIILLSTKSKCTHAEFTRVCEMSKKSNVYLFQTFNDESCVLLAKKGNDLPANLLDKSPSIEEKNVLKYLDNPLNAICAPPGMGKSTLMKVLYNNCPSHYWAVYVDLINYNAFLATKPDSKVMWNCFLRNEGTKDTNVKKQFKGIFRKNKKMYLYLDGLDEVDSSYVNSVLDFIKEASSDGINVWISSRENLRQMISQTLNVVPIEIQELSKEKQEKYIYNKLKEKYRKEEITIILKATYSSADLNNSQQLLGIPLQLHIITEMFLNNDDAYRKIEEKDIFVLTQMYKLFFDGKMTSALNKIVAEKQIHQIGHIRALLKQYETVALKACLNSIDFGKLNLNSKESEEFIKDIKENGDKYGIIKKISENDDVAFDHQTYAEYFACVWLKNNTEKIVLLKKDFFSPRYNNLRLMFDVMLAENNPLHLSVLYKNTHQFEKYIDQMNIKDAGGRTSLHLICTYGMKYRLSYPYQRYFLDKEDLVTPNRELDCYVFMAKTLAQKQFDAKNKDDLFSFDYLDYCLEANCLYPIELFLELKLLDFVGIKETIFGYYDAATLAYYSAQMGYPNLFCAVILAKPQLVHRMIREKNLLQSTISGFKKETKNASKSLENYKCIVSFLSCSGFDINAPDQHNKIPLARACETGDYEITKILLECGASVNVLDIDNMNMLHYVSKLQKRNPDILKLFVEIGIEVNAQDKNGVTPLQLACGHGIYENAKMLLECSASINIVDKDNNNSLHYASQSRQGNPNITKLLIEKGIDVNLQNNNGMTALQVSCQSGNYENSLMLLECDALMNIRDNENNNALHHASKLWEDNRDLLKLLIKKGIHIDAQNKYGETVLQLACLKGDQEIVEIALEHNASVNISNEGLSNALHYASTSWWNNRDIIKLLIKKGIEVNAQNENGTTALQLACGNGDLEITKMLLEFGTCINIVDKQNHTALNYASKLSTDNRNIIKLLIKKGINVSAESKNGTTALQFTCLSGVYENTKMLLDFGASVNIVDKSNNNNLLHFATASQRRTGGIIRLLIKKGIDLNAKNKNGITALQLACERGVYANAKLLLDCGASINILDKGNNNALHFASSSKYDTTDVVNLLITRGIDVNIQNKSGATALHLVCEKGSHESAHILLKYGSSINVVDKDNCSALHYASKSWTENRNIIKLLIEKGIDVNIQDESGNTALLFACKNCDYEITEMLFKVGSSINDMDKENNNALHYAAKAECENEDIFELLIEKGINVNFQNKSGTTALHLACENALCDVAKTLLESAASVNILDIDSNNALHYYVRTLDRNLRKIINKQWENILDLALDQGTAAIITLLVENGVDVNAKNKNGMTPLLLTCTNKYICSDVVPILLKCGALINLMDEEHNSALHYASDSEEDNQLIMNLLINYGVDVNAQNKYGTTALQLACKNGVYGNIKILLEHYASIKIMDKNNQSALHYALESEADNQCVKKLLIEKGIDINTRSENGTTALQLACKKGVYDLVDMLLEFGASVNTLDKCNNNALHYGLWARGDNRRILKLLIEKCVDIRVQNKIKVAAFQLV